MLIKKQLRPMICSIKISSFCNEFKVKEKRSFLLIICTNGNGVSVEGYVIG